MGNCFGKQQPTDDSSHQVGNKVLYVLQLSKGRIYVGTTMNIEKRIKQHREGHGALWTQLYTFEHIIEVREVISIYDEENVTKEYMRRYGIDLVRGSKFVLPVLPEVQIIEIETSWWAADSSLCQRCGGNDHWATHCRATVTVTGRELSVHQIPNEPPVVTGNKSKICDRCGYHGHTLTQCYAKRHKDGTEL